METTLVTVLILGLTISHFNIVQGGDDATSTTAKAPAAAAPTKQHAPLPESAPRGPGKPRRDWRKRYGLKPLKDEQKEQ
ncbi:hypothetical protein KSF78_0000237 [Schistosoma japonicum]|nr:hypothetical protein KSF78_0000237 [Schistosoma japonicum]